MTLVPTPIGNLGDITLRAIEALRVADVVYAEDTRRTAALLHHLQISKKLKSYHEHNKESAGAEIKTRLEAGEQIALVTDAGMPGISDPGADLVSMCIAEGLDFVVLPGATAFSVAFVGAGLLRTEFCFCGFLPKKAKDRRARLETIAWDQRPQIFYEAPHALIATLESMLEVLGDRWVCLARELTKLHEEYRRGQISELLSYYEEHEPRGEYVIVVEGAEEKKTEVSEADLTDEIARCLAEGMGVKELSQKLAEVHGIKKSQVYQWVLNAKNR